MKSGFFLSAVMLLSQMNISHGQLLKNIRKKVQSAVETTVMGKGESMGTGTDSQSGTTAKLDKEALVNAEKYGRQLFTLDPEENIIYGESSLTMRNDGSNFKMITFRKKQFFLYENSTKSGPFTSPPVTSLDNWKKGGIEEENDYIDYDMAEGSKYLSGGTFVVDGKSYGKAAMVHNILHYKENHTFYAVVSKHENQQTNYYFISEKYSHKIASKGYKIIVSPNGETGGIIIPADHFNKESDKEIPLEMEGEKVMIVLANGKSIGPFTYSQEANNYLVNGNYVQDGSATQKTVLVNGKALLTFNEGDHTTSGTLFLNKNGTACAWFDRGDLYFSDGTRITGALHPKLSSENSRQLLNWIAIQNNSVYACKKEL